MEVEETWKRPRNPRGNALCLWASFYQLCLLAWTEPSEEATIQQYFALHTEVANMLSQGLDQFIDQAIATATIQASENRHKIGIHVK